MTRRLLELSLLALLGAALLAGIGGATTLSVAQVTSDTNRDAETSIAINPLNQDNFVAAWITREPTGWPTVGVR
jgi:hypothetical protein